MKTRFILTFVLLGFLLLGFALAQSTPDQQMLRAIDAQSNFAGDLSAVVSLETQDPDEGSEVQEAQFFRRDGEELFLVLFRLPEVQLGQGYLMLRDGLWFYDPESRQFTFTARSENFSGSDARNSDFEASSLASDYQVAAWEEGTLGAFEVWILELEATSDEVTYPFVKLWVAKEDTLVLKTEDYSLSERLLRTSYYPSYTRAGESFIPNKMIFVDELVEGSSTTVELKELSTAPIPDYVFSKAYVERVNR